MNDPLEHRLRALRPSPLPDEMQARLDSPQPRSSGRRGVIVSVCFAAAASAAIIVIMQHANAPSALRDDIAPVLANTSSRRVEDARPLAVITEGQRAWELVEVKWTEDSTFVSVSGQPLAAQASITHRTIVPVEIILD